MSTARSRRVGAIDALLDTLPPLTLVVGKGGVGKTTCAAGLTACLSERGERTLLVSTDPAGSLGSVLGIGLTPGAQQEIAELPGSHALQLDAASARQAFLARWRDTIVTILDRGTYLDAEDIEGLVDAAFPGGDEIFALLTLAELIAEEGTSAWRRIIVDTAPTGHTLRLLALPETFDAMIALLESMQGKYRFMVTALTHRYRTETADEFLAAMRRSMSRLRASLGDPLRAAAVLVTRSEDVVLRETSRYARALADLRVSLAAIVVESVGYTAQRDSGRSLEDVKRIGRAVFALPKVEPPPVGVEALRALMRHLRAVPGDLPTNRMVRFAKKRLRASSNSAVESELGGGPPATVALSLLRPVTIVGGKGGVGKTTVSCALAITAASATKSTGRVLLVSTDPAPSIGDAFGIGDPGWARRSPEQLSELPNLDIWQMDATTAFDELRERYRDRIDQLFDAWVGRGVDVVQDREIMRDLLALAPPGIDELYALSVLGEILEEQRYERIIVDPAPTGHLLRLLEMPTIALDWTHRLMRIILKYREIASLGDAAQELVGFSRRTRALDQLLHDPARAAILLVSLNEPVVETESMRLASALRAARIAVVGQLQNRVVASAKHSSGAILGRQIIAPEFDRSLVGIAAISDWCRRWQERD